MIFWDFYVYVITIINCIYIFIYILVIIFTDSGIANFFFYFFCFIVKQGRDANDRSDKKHAGKLKYTRHNSGREKVSAS